MRNGTLVASLLVLAVLVDLAPARAEPSVIPAEPSSSMAGSDPSPEAVAGKRPSVAPKQTTQTPSVGEVPIGFSLNTPLLWVPLVDHLASVGISAYVGLNQHHAVRANLAWYSFSGPLLQVVLTGYASRGRTVDAGVSWVWYPRRLWDGFMIEGGMLYRHRNLRIASDFDEGDTLSKGSSYAPRAMIGWSWLVTRHLFIAAAAGASVEYRSGRSTPPDPAIPYDFSGWEIVAESYLHIGLAFGR